MRHRTIPTLALWLLALLVSAAAQAQTLPDGVARIHYQRPDGDYQGFELHVWEDTLEEVTWQDGLDIAGTTDFGVYWDVRLAEGAQQVGFIVHRGDEKDPGPDLFLQLDDHGREVWLLSGSAEIYSALPSGGGATAEAASAAETADATVARIHYRRPDGDYDGFELHVWEDTSDSVTWEDGLDIAGFDDYGAYWDVNLIEGAQRVGFIVHRGDEKDPGPDMFLILDQHGTEIWLVSGSDQILTSPPIAPPGEGIARIHYFRPDGDYDGFELHVWEDTVEEVTWQDGLEIAGTTDFGVYWDVRLTDGAERLGFIVHRGDEKDPGPDQFLIVSEMGNEVWLLSGSTEIFVERPELRAASSGDLGRAQAHWLRPDLIAWDLGTPPPRLERGAARRRRSWAGTHARGRGRRRGGAPGVRRGRASARGGGAVPAPRRSPRPAPRPLRRRAGGRAAARPAGGLDRRRSVADRRHRRADPRRARRALCQRRGARGRVARRHADDRGLGADGAVGPAPPVRRRRGHPGRHAARRRDRRLVRDGRGRLDRPGIPVRGDGLRALDPPDRDQPRHRPVRARPDHQTAPAAASSTSATRR